MRRPPGQLRPVLSGRQRLLLNALPTRVSYYIRITSPIAFLECLLYDRLSYNSPHIFEFPRHYLLNILISADAAAQPSRREALSLALLATAAAPLISAPSALAAKARNGYVAYSDSQDGYSFSYPFGWQEVAVDGLDVVFKDVIEPLESVSVNLVPTEKKDILEYGDAKEVAFTLADKVLTGPTQGVDLVNATERMLNGRRYIDFEYLVKSRGYTKHAAASVTIANGKLYTLETGSNERRWGKIGPKISGVVQSFEVVDRY